MFVSLFDIILGMFYSENEENLVWQAFCERENHRCVEREKIQPKKFFFIHSHNEAKQAL